MRLMQFISIALLSLFFSQSVQASSRIALVIGNSAYVHATALPNPQNDASDMAAKLEALDFEVIKGIDLDFTQMRQVIRQYVNRLEDAEMALFFYAGHGLQVDGRNYMAPIDARLENENDLEFEAIDMSMVLSAMERNTETNLVFLDACRNNPLARNLARSMGTRSAAVGSGLARIGIGVGTFISFATQPGNVALDGEERNSPFTTALLKHLGTPGEGISHSMVRVRNEVLQSTKGRQVPWDNSSLTGEVVLRLKIEIDDSNAKMAAEKERQDALVEVTYWNSIKDADDVAFFEAYLNKYPNGQFSDIASLRLKTLKQAATSKAAESNAGLAARRPSEDTQAVDRKTLARLDPGLAGSGQEKTAISATPDEIELGLNLTPENYQQVQETLNALGYDVGPADGAFGPKSRAGLRKYQIRNGIEEDGYLSRKTLDALVKTVETTPPSYDGVWLLEFHRYNYSGSDPSGTNLRTLLAKAKVRVRDGELFVVSNEIFSSDKTYFDTFRGHLTKEGKLSLSMSLDSLFGKEQVRDVRVSGHLPKLVPFGQTVSIRGSQLWVNPKKSENVWLRLDVARAGS